MVVRAGENSRRGLEVFRAGEEEEEGDLGVMPRMRIEGGQEALGGRDEEGFGVGISFFSKIFFLLPFSFSTSSCCCPVDGLVWRGGWLVVCFRTEVTACRFSVCRHSMRENARSGDLRAKRSGDR